MCYGYGFDSSLGSLTFDVGLVGSAVNETVPGTITYSGGGSSVSIDLGPSSSTDDSGTLTMIGAGLGLIVVGGLTIALAPEIGATGIALVGLNALGQVDLALGATLAGAGVAAGQSK